jgi:hypothetical protein
VCFLTRFVENEYEIVITWCFNVADVLLDEVIFQTSLFELSFEAISRSTGGVARSTSRAANT